MLRALFQKTGNAVYLSHLDLMRLFQRSFKRAGLPLTHTQGFNPRPSVSIALPLSLGVESRCELLDFELETDAFSCDEICTRLNQALVEGVHVLSVYAGGGKIKNLAYLDCAVLLEYDAGVPQNAAEQIEALFSREEVTVEKKGKKGVVEQNIISMIRKISGRMPHLPGRGNTHARGRLERTGGVRGLQRPHRVRGIRGRGREGRSRA